MARRTWVAIASRLCRRRRRSVATAIPFRQHLRAFRARTRSRRPRGSGHRRLEGRREADGRVARQAGVDRSSARRSNSARVPAPSTTSELVDPDVQAHQLLDHDAEIRAQRISFARSEHKDLLVLVGICPHLGCSPGDKFVPGRAAFAARQIGPAAFSAPAMARLSTWLGPRLQEQARARQPRSAALHVYLTDSQAAHRRRQEISMTLHPLPMVVDLRQRQTPCAGALCKWLNFKEVSAWRRTRQ